MARCYAFLCSEDALDLGKVGWAQLGWAGSRIGGLFAVGWGLGAGGGAAGAGGVGWRRLDWEEAAGWRTVWSRGQAAWHSSKLAGRVAALGPGPGRASQPLPLNPGGTIVTLSAWWSEGLRLPTRPAVDSLSHSLRA